MMMVNEILGNCGSDKLIFICLLHLNDQPTMHQHNNSINSEMEMKVNLAKQATLSLTMLKPVNDTDESQQSQLERDGS